MARRKTHQTPLSGAPAGGRDHGAASREPVTSVTPLQRAEAASEAKSRFLAMVSHEVRTPLNGILGMTHLLERTELTPEQADYVAAVRQSGAALFELVEDLLDFSTIEAGRFALNPAAIDIRSLIEGAVELMAARAHEKQLDIACHVAADVPQDIVIDAKRLRQIVFNLVGNALKFTLRGSVTVWVARDGDQLTITVEDTGKGLERSDQERIFEEFEQADTTSTRQHGGVGLGLAISSRLVAAMGGTIGVDSTPGRGSRFIVTVPLINGSSPLDRDRQDGLAGRRILIVMEPGPPALALAAMIADAGGEAVLPGHEYEAAQVTDIIVDARLSGTETALHSAAGVRRILMVRPSERGLLNGLGDRGYDGWLVAPLRARSLVTVLGKAPTTTPSRHIRAHCDAMTSLRIVVAEDNPVNALLVVSVLRRAGHRVTLVQDGVALVAECHALDDGAARYDLVITDMSMPQMDGADALAMIRAHEHRHGIARTPVIVLTADGQQSTRNHLLGRGADHFLEKPIDPDALLELVARYGSQVG
jgi:CheY-like chemotaxis protein